MRKHELITYEESVSDGVITHNPRITSYIETVIRDALANDTRKMTVQYDYVIYRDSLIMSIKCSFQIVSRKIINRIEKNLRRNFKMIKHITIVHPNNFRLEVWDRYRPIEYSTKGLDPNHTVARIRLSSSWYTITDIMADYCDGELNAIPHLNRLKKAGYDHTMDYGPTVNRADQWNRYVAAMKMCYNVSIDTIVKTIYGRIDWNGKPAESSVDDCV